MFCIFLFSFKKFHCWQKYQSLTEDVSSVVGVPWRCGVLTTLGGMAGIGLGHLLGREHGSTPQSEVGAPRLCKRSLSRLCYCCFVCGCVCACLRVLFVCGCWFHVWVWALVSRCAGLRLWVLVSRLHYWCCFRRFFQVRVCPRHTRMSWHSPGARSPGSELPATPAPPSPRGPSTAPTKSASRTSKKSVTRKN